MDNRESDNDSPERTDMRNILSLLSLQLNFFSNKSSTFSQYMNEIFEKCLQPGFICTNA